jgi:hypothetical protein
MSKGKKVVLGHVEYAKIYVGPGDFGTKFRTVPNANRQIDRNWARKLWSSWDTVEGQTMLVLYPDPVEPGVFRILDGQHRIFAASEWGTKPSVFEAQIRPAPTTKEVAGQIANLNLGKRYRTSDHLANARSGSLWPSVFEKRGIAPVYTRSGPKFNWPAIIGGTLLASGKTSADATDPDNQRELWLTADPSLIEEVASTLAWWKPAVDGAAKIYKLYTLQSITGIAFALELCRENAGKPSLKGTPARLLSWPELPSIRPLTAARGVLLGDALLKGVNYRLWDNNLLTWHGKTGREGA